jgi:sulfoxide reductase heme-binding subunit YedZ
MIPSLILWRDRKGRLSPLRIGTLAMLLWPTLLALYATAAGGLGARPLNDLIHRSGYWAMVFLLVSLAITPLRQAGRFGRLVDVRRMIGVASFLYAITHFGLYVVDQKFDLVRVATEIAVRPYLTVGFVALLGLVALGVTSNDTLVRRLGGVIWRRLHMATYAITLLTIVHFFQQTKADVSTPILYAGLFGWLMGYRLLARRREGGALPAAWLAGLALGVAALVFVGEAAAIAIAFGAPFTAVLASAFDPDLGIRPGWYVLAAGVAVVVLDVARGWTESRTRSRVPGPRRDLAAAGPPG